MANEDVKLEEDMSTEELAALKESESFIENFKEEDFADPDKTEELRKRLADAKTTVHQKRHYRDKVGELSTKLKEKDTPPATPPKVEKPEKKDDEGDIDPQVANEFRFDHPELSKDVAKTVLKHAKAYKISPEEALKDPLMQKYVKEELDKKDIDDATITPGNRGGQGPGDKKDWSTASEKEVTAERNRIMQGQ